MIFYAKQSEKKVLRVKKWKILRNLFLRMANIYSFL